MQRLYFMPLVTITDGNEQVRVPSHFVDFFQLHNLPVAIADFGTEPFCMVTSDVPDLLHATLTAFVDVLAVPDNADSQLGLQQTVVHNFLEAHHVPAQWLTSTMTHRAVARGVRAMFEFMQKYSNVPNAAPLFGGTITLDSLVSDLPAALQTALAAGATAAMISGASITPGNTLRSVLKTLGSLLPVTQYQLGPYAL